jgi:hypothetical protein
VRIALLIALVACGGKAEEAPVVDPTEAPSKTPATDAGAKKPLAKPPPVTSPLPEKGPHPDYPTPVAAGTDKIFLLEEPDRGPAAPLEFPYPSSTDGTPHASCELGPTTVVCGDGKPAKTGIWYTVAKSKNATVVTAHRGSLVEAAHVYLMENGVIKQRISFDEYRRLEYALLFATPTRYTQRMRNGRNGLPGCGAMEFELDKAGRMTSRRCLQWLGEPMRDTSGVAITKYVRDPRGFIAGEHRFGLDGKPVVATDNVHHVRYELDAQGRHAAERFFGIDDKPIANHKGCHGYQHARDPGGLLTRTTCIGADGKPSNDSRIAAWQEFGHDERGCQTRLRNVALGAKTPRDPGVDYVVDERCAVLSHTCVKGNGARTACATGDPARYDYKRDDAGQPISISHYAPDGTAGKHPVWNVFEIRHEYDERGNATVTTCHDAFGKLTTCTNLGFARQQSTYDNVGREIARVFFDTDGNPAMNTGAVTRKFIYDNYDHLFEGRGYDKAGQVIETLGNAVRRDLYDIAHRKFAVVLLDKDGKPARYTGCYGGSTCPKTWHAMRIVRKPDGIVDKNQFFDERGQLIETKDCGNVRCFR